MIETFKKLRPNREEIQRLRSSWKRHPRYDRARGLWLANQSGGSILRDYSGANCNGTFTSTPPIWSTHVGGPSLLFNGSSSGVIIQSVADINLTTQLTIAATIHPTAISGGERCIYSAGEPGVNYWFFILLSTGRLRQQVAVSSANIQSLATFSVNQTYRVVSTNNNGTVSLYINGKLDNSGALTITTPVGTSGIGFQSNNGASPRYFFAGHIYDVVLLSRPWSAVEVKNDFAHRMEAYAYAVSDRSVYAYTGTTSAPSGHASTYYYSFR